MTEVVTDLFDQALERYKAGEDATVLIPVFQDICDHTPKNATGWACLAWLYLLEDKPKIALKFAQKSVKLDKSSPQARVNLVLAMLETDTKGVRPHIEAVQQLMSFDTEIRDSVLENVEDGLSRKPDWKSMQRVKNWLTES